jgi:hypothetical protein
MRLEIVMRKGIFLFCRASKLYFLFVHILKPKGGMLKGKSHGGDWAAI